MKINLTSKRISAAFLAAALCASLGFAAVQKASANDNGGKSNKDNKFHLGLNLGSKIETRLAEGIKDAGMRPQVAIGANGKVLVRGAKVTAISGTDISAQVSWGSYDSNWTVDASNAKFLRHFGGNSELSEIEVGHIISFSGMLDTGASSATVEADFVKDWSIDRGDVPHTGTLQGELTAVGGTTAPTTLTVEVKDDDFTVNVSASTAILNKNWGALDLSDFEVGDTVRFYGEIDGSVSDATVVRNVSR